MYADRFELILEWDSFKRVEYIKKAIPGTRPDVVGWQIFKLLQEIQEICSFQKLCSIVHRLSLLKKEPACMLRESKRCGKGRQVSRSTRIQ